MELAIQALQTFNVPFANSRLGGSALAMSYALTSDLLRNSQSVGTLTGLLLTFGNGFGIMAPVITGYVVSATQQFDGAFELAAVLVLIGATLALTATRKPIG